MPRICRSESDLSRPRHSAAWGRHGMCELASAVLRQHVGDLPAFGEWQGSGRETGWERHMCELALAVLRRHVGDLSAFGEWQGRDRGTAWERHGLCELAFNAAGERQENFMGTAWYV
jgi:hypothetical protein